MNNSRSMKADLIVIGAGAIGLGLAVACISDNERVCLLGRNKIVESGLLNVSTDTLDAEFDSGIDDEALIVVAVKDYDIDNAALEYERELANASAIIALQNGLGSAERLKKQKCVIRAITWACAQRVSQTEVSWKEPIKLAVENRVSKKLLTELISQQLANRFVHVDFVPPDIFRVLQFEKLVVNITTNTLAAYFNMACAELAKNHRAIQLAEAIADEVLALSNASGISFREDPKAIIRRAWMSMGEFKPSMLQDSHAGKPLELRSIVDEPLKLANSLKIPMPTLRVLSKALHDRLT